MSTFLSMQLLLVFLSFMTGASLASFAGVVIERVPQKESINGRSHCACGRQLKWYENIPVFGWLAVGGKAKCCNTKLPVWYFLIELGGGILFALISFLFIFTI